MFRTSPTNQTELASEGRPDHAEDEKLSTGDLGDTSHQKQTLCRVHCEFLGGVKGALRIPSLSFQLLRRLGCTAPHNSFVSLSLVDSNPIGSTKKLTLENR
jgi:hypothetical protein